MFKFNTEMKNNLLNCIRDKIDIDGPGYINIYEGDIPESLTDLNTDNLLGTVKFTFPSAKDAVEGVSVYTLEKEALATKSGVASWGTIVSGDNTILAAFSISAKDDTETSRGVLVLNTTKLVSGGAILINNMVLMLD